MRSYVTVKNHQPVPLQALDDVLASSRVLWVGRSVHWNGDTSPDDVGWCVADPCAGCLHVLATGGWLSLRALDGWATKARPLQADERLAVVYEDRPERRGGG